VRILALLLVLAAWSYAAELTDRPVGMTDAQVIAVDPATVPDARVEVDWSTPAPRSGSVLPVLPVALLALAFQLVYDRSFKEFSCRTRC